MAEEPPGALSEERTWTSSDGKTLTGYLVSTQDGDGRFVAVSNSVTLLVNGRPFRLPLDRLSEPDRDFIKAIVAATNNQGFAEFPPCDFQLTRREQATFFQQFSGLVFPTFGHPQVAITNVNLSNVQALPEGGAKASVAMQGDFYSALANKIGHADPKFGEGRIYLAGKDEPVATIDFEVNPKRREEPKDAEYTATLEDLEFPAGENVLVVAFPDPVSGLEGRRAFSFDVADKEGSPPVGNLQQIAPPGPGDAFVYQLTAKELPDSDNPSLRLCIGDFTDYAECAVQPISSGSSQVHLVTRLDSRAPNSFCLMPSRVPYEEDEIREAFQKAGRITLPDGVSEEFQFLVGYAHGVFVNGADVFTSDGEVIEKGASLSDTGTSLQLKAHWRDGDQVGKTFTIPLPAGFREGEEMGLDEFSHPQVMWEIAKRFRDESTEVGKVERLLDVGLENAEEIPRNWIMMLSESISEPLLLIHLEMSEQSALQHGYLVGAAIAGAANRALPPLDPGEASEWEKPTPEELNEHIESFLDLVSSPGG